MGTHNIELLFEQSQDKIYIDQIKCILCDGLHGNDTFCQADFNSIGSN